MKVAKNPISLRQDSNPKLTIRFKVYVNFAPGEEVFQISGLFELHFFVINILMH